MKVIVSKGRSYWPSRRVWGSGGRSVQTLGVKSARNLKKQLRYNW
jgi:hypothetical protein